MTDKLHTDDYFLVTKDPYIEIGGSKYYLLSDPSKGHNDANLRFDIVPDYDNAEHKAASIPRSVLWGLSSSWIHFSSYINSNVDLALRLDYRKGGYAEEDGGATQYVWINYTFDYYVNNNLWYSSSVGRYSGSSYGASSEHFKVPLPAIKMENCQPYIVIKSELMNLRAFCLDDLEGVANLSGKFNCGDNPKYNLHISFAGNVIPEYKIQTYCYDSHVFSSDDYECKYFYRLIDLPYMVTSDFSWLVPIIASPDMNVKKGSATLTIRPEGAKDGPAQEPIMLQVELVSYSNNTFSAFSEGHWEMKTVNGYNRWYLTD